VQLIAKLSIDLQGSRLQTIGPRQQRAANAWLAPAAASSRTAARAATSGQAPHVSMA